MRNRPLGSRSLARLPCCISSGEIINLQPPLRPISSSLFCPFLLSTPSNASSSGGFLCSPYPHFLMVPRAFASLASGSTVAPCSAGYHRIPALRTVESNRSPALLFIAPPLSFHWRRHASPTIILFFYLRQSANILGMRHSARCRSGRGSQFHE